MSIGGREIVLAGLLTGVVDGLFASVQTFFTGSTIARLWQGVAATVLGPSAFDRGTGSALIGVLLHFGVAMGWSIVFAGLVTRFEGIRRTLSKAGGPIAIASIYGPAIWMTMSLVVIPQLTGRPTTITPRWWVQFFGHIPFVALPMVTVIGLRFRPMADAAKARVS